MTHDELCRELIAERWQPVPQRTRNDDLRDVIGTQREADYLPLIRQRIDRRRDPVEALRGQAADLGLFDLLGGEGA